MILPFLVEWLAAEVKGETLLTSPGGEVLAQSSADAHEAAAPTAETRQRIASGNLDSAVLDEGPLKARLLPVGPSRRPHAVLTVTRAMDYSAPDMALISSAADLLALLVPKVMVEQDLPRLRRTAAEFRGGILQLLMGGQVAVARRTAARILPNLLTDSVRVAVVDCGTTDRDSAIQGIEAALSGAPYAHVIHPDSRALVSHCPVYDHHVIVVLPTADGETEAIVTALRDIVAKQPDHYLGVSGTTDIALTADAYRDACRALRVAHRAPTRTCDYAGHSGVASVLGDQAQGWAESFLCPLLGVPWTERDQLFHTLRVSLSFPTKEAAKLLGVHRNTVTGRVKRAADLLHLDLADIRARALLDLALQITAHRPGMPGPTGPGITALEPLLSAPAVIASAEMMLQPLEKDSRNLRRTLVAWLAHNTNADAAGADLDMHGQTVRNHLRRVEELLERELLGGAYEAHDIVIALFIVGDFPTLPTEKPSLSPAYIAQLREGHTEIDTLPLGWMEEKDRDEDR
jgi:sugar diacid utilization regulator